MKRRLFVAGLTAIAVVVLAGVGNATSAPSGAFGGTRGQPWTGSPGVTESVGTLNARQRAKDRERGGRPLPIRAKPEPGEISPGPHGKEGKAEGEPDVGGEGARPKLAAVAAPDQRTGQAAASAASSFAVGTSFLGAQVSESGFIPPDSMGAVGPTQIVVDVNGRIKVFDKQGNVGGLNVSDSTFWASVANGSEPTDPGIEYDRLTGHWIVTAVNVENTNNRVMVAVSSGPTITNSSSFTFFFFNQNVPPPAGDSGLFADYPKIGVDANAIYIGVNEFSGNSFAHSTGFVVRKSSVIGGGPIVVTAFRDLTGGSSGPGPASPQGVLNMVPGNTEGYFVGADNQVLSKLDVRRVTNPGGTPSISGNLQVTVPSTAQPLSVPASGSHHNLDALDDRLFEAMINKDPNGVVSLWTAHNIRVNSSGVGSGIGDRDGDRWYQLGSLSSTPTLLQSGTLFDTAASTPRFFWIPSIAMNGQGHASLNSSTAGSGRFAEIASSGHLASDLAGTTEPFDTTQTSSSSYNLGSPNPQRWGDYSQTVVDPTDNMTFWTFQEYANATNSWGLRVIKEQPPPPATPSTASPNPIAPGQSSVSVQITGTQVNGSGFFDPGSDPGGPGFSSHIAASVSGGVTVNSVTYTDPTHVTLDLNTTGAGNGSKDVTITNPDGQSSTGFNLLVVGNDITPPAPPTLTGTTPTSPANDNSPRVFGAAEGGSTVKLYTDSACTAGPVGTGSASQFASPGIQLSTPVAPNSTTTFHATATDLSNNTSDCSSSSVTYVEDSTPPSAPAISATVPPSPSNSSTTPSVIGTSSSDTATVQLFTQANCGGSVQASGSKTSFESGGIAVSVAPNATTTISAKALDAAGNPSACSNNFPFTNDSIGPTAPTISSTNPASPSNSDTTPMVIGSSSSDTATIQVFTQANCGGSVQVSGSKMTFEGAGIPVSVTANATTTISTRALDAATNPSTCSNNFAYTHDSIAPAAPTISSTNPASPSSSTTPKVIGSSSSDTANLQIFTQANCGGSVQATGSKSIFESTGIQVTVGSNATTTLSAKALDGAGNPSGCSNNFSYTHDSIAPTAPTISSTNPASPSNSDTTPMVIGSSSSDTANLQIFTQANCGGSVQATGSKSTFESTGIQVTVGSNATTTLSAKALDAAGNPSSCSNNFSYTHDSIAPTAPSITSTNPASPSNSSTTPMVIGSSSSDTATVQVFTQANCGGSVQATGFKPTFESTGIQVTVGSNATTTLSAKALDAAGNPSGCSSNFSYTHDSIEPAAPTSLASSPVSPANENSPKISGSAEAGSTVKVYKAPTTGDCTGPNLAATDSAANFASPGLTVSVGDNSSTTFRATATDAAGNPSACSSSSVTYVEDSTLPGAPTVTGTSPISPGNTTLPKVIGTAESGSTVDLYTNAACTGTPVASGSDTTFASPGIAATVTPNSTTTFHATSSNGANTSACSPTSATYLEDATPPVASIDSGPSGVTNDHSPTFTFSATDTFPVGDTVTFQCSIDQGTVVFGACSGPGNTHAPAGSLPDGSYTFRVRATDQAGNVSSPATQAFTVTTPGPLDSIPPETTIVKGPKKKTTKRRPGFQFTSSEFGSAFQCQLDAGQFQPCSSPFKPPKLRLGKHVLRVEAIDPAGNVDPTPAVKKFKVIA